LYKCVPGNSSTRTKEGEVSSSNNTATADSATPQTSTVGIAENPGDYKRLQV